MRMLLMVAAGSLLLASCETGPAGSPEGDPLTLTDWQAVSINDTPVSAPRPLTLSFMEGRASGHSGCNQYSGSVDYDTRHIKFGQVISTKMACMDDGVMQLEARYLQTLSASESYVIGHDGKLSLTGKQGHIEFTSQPRQMRP